ncbi:dihydrofolate reductase-like domain-containing protein [Catenaria anguillulae PL171]|uniref:Dihydrofolate reductase n=1 Tax=Catenaria anguillulae PL171 TaxID=765915 RepID=A0A1Y2HQ83_9FUNG|nr:dihydrofolate reductase-like domain-containing protein [Catenaria anguillulae PL171]
MTLPAQFSHACAPTVPLSLVVAVTASRAIGKNGGLPWARLPTDMKFFRDVTTLGMNADPAHGKQNAVIMGRKTWESIPPKFRPLPGRVNVVLTRNVDRIRESLPDGVFAVSTLESAIDLLGARDGCCSAINHIFVVGGGQVYADALAHPSCSRVFLTQVNEEIDGCDTWFPDVEALGFTRSDRAELEAAAAPVKVPLGTVTESDLSYEFVLYSRSY